MRLLPGRRKPAYDLVAPGEEVLPGLRVVASLAHGRRLDTYDAFDEDRDCRVVVKILRTDRLDEEHVRAAVLREGEIVTTLAHPHLVRGYAVHDDPPAVVLETLTGATLGHLLDDGPLAVDDVRMLGQQLVSVLGYLHRHDWLHLDLKPANVVVRGGQAVLIDLSLAARPGDARPGAGTVGYLAPEQATGRGLSTATDVWGLGVTLMEALTGDLPFGGGADWDSGRQRRSAARRTPSFAGVPEAWIPMLRACLDVDQAGRPALVDVRSVLERG